MKTRPAMKLSDKTISVLKNFSSINQSILFKEGNKLRTISVMKNILAQSLLQKFLNPSIRPKSNLMSRPVDASE